MKTVYKLTDENGKTYNNTQWGPGVSHSGTGQGDLCGPGWIHYYSHPLLAILFNLLHANFLRPRLWEAEPSGEIRKDRGLKYGSKTLEVIREISLPEITTTQQVAFAIFCALECYSDPYFVIWAKNWLNNTDRSEISASLAADAAAVAADAAQAAVVAAVVAAAHAADAADAAVVAAAYDAADAAQAAVVAAVVAAAAHAADAAQAAVVAAAYDVVGATAADAAFAAARAAGTREIDFIKLAEKACQIK
jgi:hypothetical protein